MGTNYYHHEKPPCPTCGHCDEPRHIGKSSAGWCFSLHIEPEDGIYDLADWQTRWSSGVIKNEYGELISPEQMLAAITERGTKGQEATPMGYRGRDEFYSTNHCEPGPNGLLRHRIGPHCIGHGEGTWDLITGEFS